MGDYRNLVEVLRRQAGRLGPRPALWFKRHGLYRTLTWREYHGEARACAAALVEAGIRPGDRVGLLAENRLEWMLADMGILAAGAVNVPPHAPLTAGQIHYQLADAGVRWLFASNGQQLEKVRQIRAELPTLQGVVVFDRQAVAGDALSWEGFLQCGRRALARTAPELDRRAAALGLDDLATIMYTSGTTGHPKGVMLTHGNLLSNVLGVLAVAAPEPDDLQLNWLPFSHIYARTCDFYKCQAGGITLALAESAETVLANLQEVRPTYMNSVPRLYEKVLAAVTAADPQETGRRLRAAFGPRIELLWSGGAPLPPAVARAYLEAGLPLLQGYGLTESSPVISFNQRERFKIETVGLPIPSVEVQIAADGEVLTRGPHVMPGYWNNPQATAEAIRDGWLCTGDLGRLDEDGFLSITGRKKELLVLSNGKKVVPNYIEGLLAADPCIDQAVVCGEGRNFLTALIVPHWPNLRSALRNAGHSGDGDEETLAVAPTIISCLMQRIQAALIGVAGWEQVKKILVLPRPFSVADEELTVSLKLRRKVVVDRHAATLEALYRE
jgi:long-chain acyl-CoA synthetase